MYNIFVLPISLLSFSLPSSLESTLYSLSMFLDTDECLSSPCVNSLSCSDLVNDYSCQCKPGWKGKNCDQGKQDLFYLEVTI